MARDAFSARHPAVGFLFFALVLVLTTFLMHPVTLAVSLLAALLYCARLDRAGLRQVLRLLVPLALLAALINALFNHEGATILWYFPSGNPLTLESLLYGLAAAIMLAAVVLWLRCASRVLSSDKIVWLFGRTAPVFGLLLSMTLRFVPLFRARFREVFSARRKLGKSRLRRAMEAFSITVTWSLESAIETADSMKRRGYGLSGRTAYSRFRLETLDRLLLGFLALLTLALCAGWALGAFHWAWFPRVHGALYFGFYAAFALLCSMPLALDLWEVRQWRLSRSGI